MGRLADRLRRIEDARGSRSCPKCGQPSNFTYDVSHIDSVEALQAAYEHGEFCEECGLRVLHPVFLFPERADTTLPVLVCRARPKKRVA